MRNFNYAIRAGKLVAMDIDIITLGLESNSRKSFGQQGLIPDNQWQVDVERWNNITLASKQQDFLDAASGPSDPRMNEFIFGPSTDQERRLCHNQVRPVLHLSVFCVTGLTLHSSFFR